MPALALLSITVVWGFTFVQVKDAVELYPVFLFLALRFAIASAALALPFGFRLARLDRRGVASGLLVGLLLGAAYAFQTLGLERVSVTSAGFITGLFVPLTPVFAALLFRDRIGPLGWVGTGLATAGLALLSGVEVGSPAGALLVLAGAAAFALHFVFVSRVAPRYDVAALALLQMLAAAGACGAVALALDPLSAPHGETLWSALVVTGLFASALGFGVQTWAQKRTSATRTALIVSMEPVFAGLFGYVLAGDRLGAAGVAGCALILAGIVVAEPALVRWARGRPLRAPAGVGRGGENML